VHQLSVVTDISTVPVNQSLDLSKRDQLALVVLYEGKHAFTATSGTATFAHACAKGMVGSIDAVTLREWGSDGEVKGGCALQPVQFSFTLGDSCPVVSSGTSAADYTAVADLDEDGRPWAGME
jgi:hypothetical protein